MKVADLFASLGIKPEKQQWDQADRLIRGVKRGLAAIAAWKIGRKFLGMIEQVSDTSDRFRKLSVQMGISSEDLQALDFSAKLASLDIEQLTRAIQRTQRSMKDADDGQEEYRKHFKELGIDIYDEEGNLRNVQDVLLDMADSFSGMDNQTRRTALAMEVMGRSGARMLPMMMGGSKAIREQMQEARELGYVVDEETGKAFEKFNDDILRVKTAIQGLKNKFVIALLPYLKDTVSVVLAWVKANRALIQQKLEAFAETLVRVFKMLAFVLSNIWKVVNLVAKAFGGLGNMIQVMTAAWLTFKSLQLLSFFGSLAKKIWKYVAATRAATAATTAMNAAQAVGGGSGIVGGVLSRVGGVAGVTGVGAQTASMAGTSVATAGASRGLWSGLSKGIVTGISSSGSVSVMGRLVSAVGKLTPAIAGASVVMGIVANSLSNVWTPNLDKILNNLADPTGQKQLESQYGKSEARVRYRLGKYGSTLRDLPVNERIPLLQKKEAELREGEAMQQKINQMEAQVNVNVYAESLKDIRELTKAQIVEAFEQLIPEALDAVKPPEQPK